MQPITANNESQRFVTLGLDTDGSVFAAWIDKRNRVPAQQEGRKYEGAGLFFACLSALLSLVIGNSELNGRTFRAGGYVGEWIADMCSAYLNRPGAIIVVLTLLTVPTMRLRKALTQVRSSPPPTPLVTAASTARHQKYCQPSSTRNAGIR